MKTYIKAVDDESKEISMDFTVKRICQSCGDEAVLADHPCKYGWVEYNGGLICDMCASGAEAIDHLTADSSMIFSATDMVAGQEIHFQLYKLIGEDYPSDDVVYLSNGLAGIPIRYSSIRMLNNDTMKRQSECINALGIKRTEDLKEIDKLKGIVIKQSLMLYESKCEVDSLRSQVVQLQRDNAKFSALTDTNVRSIVELSLAFAHEIINYDMGTTKDDSAIATYTICYIRNGVTNEYMIFNSAKVKDAEIDRLLQSEGVTSAWCKEDL